MGFWSIFAGLLARDAVRGTVRGMQKRAERERKEREIISQRVDAFLEEQSVWDLRQDAFTFTLNWLPEGQSWNRMVKSYESTVSLAAKRRRYSDFGRECSNCHGRFKNFGLAYFVYEPECCDDDAIPRDEEHTVPVCGACVGFYGVDSSTFFSRLRSFREEHGRYIDCTDYLIVD